jgi:hypothetical protein
MLRFREDELPLTVRYIECSRNNADCIRIRRVDNELEFCLMEQRRVDEDPKRKSFLE